MAAADGEADADAAAAAFVAAFQGAGVLCALEGEAVVSMQEGVVACAEGAAGDGEVAFAWVIWVVAIAIAIAGDEGEVATCD